MMFDPTVDRSSGADSNRPQFEPLEERLLLTTLQAGEWLVYNGSMDRFVLVTMTGRTGAAEILALDFDTGDLANIGAKMGALDGSWGPVDVFGGFTGLGTLDTIEDDWRVLRDCFPSLGPIQHRNKGMREPGWADLYDWPKLLPIYERDFELHDGWQA